MDIMKHLKMVSIGDRQVILVLDLQILIIELTLNLGQNLLQYL